MKRCQISSSSSEHSSQEDDQPSKRIRAAAAELPDHLVYSVYLNLPVKTLLRFRTQSKQWHDRITRCSYSAAHHRSRQRELSRAPGRVRLFFSRPGDHVSSVSACQLTPDASALELETPFKKISKLCVGSVVWRSCSSCDGLLCAVIGYAEYMDPRKRVRRLNPAVVSYNPAARRSHELPWPYKVVVLEFPPGATATSWVTTTTSFKDEKSWKTVPCDDGVLARVGNAFVFDEKGSVCVEGRVYWLTRHDDHLYKILRFDLEEEKFGLLPVPVEMAHVLGLGQFNGSLYMYVKRVAAGFDVWRMEQPEKWSMVMSIGMKDAAEVEPVGFWGEGEFVVKKSSDDSLAVNRMKEDKFMEVELDYTKVNDLYSNSYPGRQVDVHLVDMETLVV
uniref:F-box domain-containing protein n=1 Tax=Kalanchoe fedtschenkoi TaxID=63787 RepID=A0A7N0UNN7_KALFE